MKYLKALLRILFVLSFFSLSLCDCDNPTEPEYDGPWEKVAVPEGLGYYALDFLSPTDGWCCGLNSVGHWDGQKWSVAKRFGNEFTWYYIEDVHIVDGSDIWFSGHIDDRTKSDSSLIIHYDGENWEETNIPEASTIIGIWMFPDGTGWGGGGSTNGVFYYDGSDWSKYNDLSLKGFFFFSPDAGYGVGLNDIYYWDGTNWMLSLEGDGEWFQDVYFNSPNDGWAVSHAALYGVAAHYHWDGTEWTKLKGTPFDEKSLDAVHFADEDWGWVIGSGMTYFYDGEHLIWKEYGTGLTYGGDYPYPVELRDLYCNSRNDVWISTDVEYFLHFTAF